MRVGSWGWLWASIYSVLHRDPESNRAVVELAQLSPDDRVLDIGCGPGAALAAASHIVTTGSVTGVDPTARMVTVASRRVPTATVVVSGAEELPFPDDSFTVAWSIAAYHHWPEPDRGLAEAARVLVPGGRLLIVEGLLSGGHGHGLVWEGVAELTKRLEALGYVASPPQELKVGKRELVTVTATVAG